MHPDLKPLSTVALAAALLFVAPGAGAQPAASAAPSQHITRDNDNLWDLGAAHDQVTRYTRQQWIVATLRRNPDAFLLGNMHRLRSRVPLILPTDKEVTAEDASAAEGLVQKHLSALPTLVPMPPLQPLVRAEPAPAPTPAAEAPPAAPPAAQPPAATAPASTAPAPGVPVPAPSPAPADAPASAAAAPAASVPAAVPAPVPAATPTGASPRVLLWVLPLAAAGLVWLSLVALRRKRQTGQDFSETLTTLFQDTVQLIRKSKPKVITVSSAGADMAKAVERLASSTALVRSAGRELPAQEPDAGDVGLKLEIARTQLELGRQDAAAQMLRVVLLEGNDTQRRDAQTLLNGGAAPA